ncbi:hypothetical protein V3851_10855 [Paenibacillus sp. M1]|uniref:Uncharacterized protein n=1 Tax=Paenibacillus haidiansis TaxID=1574488 RepID=A0ABU7VSX3_9BACL
MQTTKKTRKPWWVAKSTALLQEYAQAYGGIYVPASFKGWVYKGQYVRIALKQGWGDIFVTVKDSGDSSHRLTIGMKYVYSPRRRLEFHLRRTKYPLVLPFRRNLRPVTMPNSAMNKAYHAKASHPSLLRSILKQEGLHESLEAHPAVQIRHAAKGHNAVLSLSETSKTPDAKLLHQGVELMKQFITALHEQGFIREKIR